MGDHTTTHTFTETEKIKVQSGDLEVGMYVCDLDRPWSETPFLFQGFELLNSDDLNVVRQLCNHVYVDVKKSSAILPQKHAHPEGLKQPLHQRLFSIGKSQRKSLYLNRTTLKEEVKSAAPTYKQASSLVRSIMDDIRLGNSIDTHRAKEAVSSCVSSVIRNPEAMLLLTRLKNKDEYTSEHSLNVSIISIAFGRHLGLDQQVLNELGLCGLLHDMGKMLTPTEILNKPSSLTKEEDEIMKRHPEDGRNILMSSSGIVLSTIDVAHSHHERMDGSGYPRNLGSNQLTYFTRIVTIADVFDALTSDRIYKNGDTTFNSLRVLHAARGMAFDPALITKFVECIGIYPMGSVVEMHNGEIGIVAGSSPQHRLQPVVKLLLDAEKHPMSAHLVNLAKPDLDDFGIPYKIIQSHHPRKFGLDVNRYIQRSLDLH
jgi:putative nucleotidyltransferase with HDIG domain